MYALVHLQCNGKFWVWICFAKAFSDLPVVCEGSLMGARAWVC